MKFLRTFRHTKTGLEYNMAITHSPSPVLNGLELNLDFKSPKTFSNTLGTNLVGNPTYNASTWGTFMGTNIPIAAPDGTLTAVRHSPWAVNGTYTITNNVATITITNHPFVSTQNLFIDFTSGGGADGQYQITKTDNNTITAPVTAADTSGSVVVYSRSGMRVGITPFTPNGTDRYTVSFWVKWVSGTLHPTMTNFLITDLRDGQPSLNYFSQLVLGRWVYITVTAAPTATSKDFVDLASDYFGTMVLDFWGAKIENQNTNNTPLPLKDSIGGYTFNVFRPEFCTFAPDKDFITFNRTSTPNSPVTITNFIGNGTTTVTATVPDTSIWSIQSAFTISGAVGTEQTKLNGTWSIGNIVNSTTFTFLISQSLAAATYTTGLGTATKSSKWGGIAETVGVGNLTYSNFAYNDHTWEVWFRINDRNASLLDGVEGYSFLTAYSGWHSGFLYNSSALIYIVKDGLSSAPTVCSWTLGTSSTQIIEGNWYQVVVVRSGNSWTPYLNGVQLGTGNSNFQPSSVNNGVSNILSLGAAGSNVPAGTYQYRYYAKNSVGAMRMYSRALSAGEVQQNFNSLRGRFGL
jgi:hypothetical protein